MVSKTRIAIQRARAENRVHQCPHNSACACGRKLCDRCGWNPEIAKARTEAFEKQWRVRNG